MRQHPYRFAHQLFPQTVFSDPTGWWSRLESGGRRAVLPVWSGAAQGLSKMDEVDPAGLSVEALADVSGMEAIVITLPEPAGMSECYYVALVRPPGGAVRYFVLERGADEDDGSARAYWAEWRNIAGGVMRIRGQDVQPIGLRPFLAAIAPELSADVDGANFQPDWSQVSSGRAAGGRRRKKKGGKLGCVLAVLVLLALVGVGGVLYYFEAVHRPEGLGEVVVKENIEPNEPFTVKYRWDGPGRARHDVWVVVKARKEGDKFALRGKLGCANFGAPHERDLSVVYYEGTPRFVRMKEGGRGRFSAWIEVDDRYAFAGSNPTVCKGTIRAEPGELEKARVVVTRRHQRPSDYLAF